MVFEEFVETEERAQSLLKENHRQSLALFWFVGMESMSHRIGHVSRLWFFWFWGRNICILYGCEDSQEIHKERSDGIVCEWFCGFGLGSKGNRRLLSESSQVVYWREWYMVFCFGSFLKVKGLGCGQMSEELLPKKSSGVELGTRDFKPHCLWFGSSVLIVCFVGRCMGTKNERWSPWQRSDHGTGNCCILFHCHTEKILWF